MAEKTIHVIRVGRGSVSDDEPTVDLEDVVAWVPETTGIKVKIKFKDGVTPFDDDDFPDNPKAGEVVVAQVRSDASEIKYEYKQPGSRLKGKRRADPVIIVKDIRNKKKKKAGSKK